MFSHSQQHVILVQDYLPLGVQGDRVAVKPGFARQTLLPRGIAVLDFPMRRDRLFADLDPRAAEQKKALFRAQRLLDSVRARAFVFLFEPAKFNPRVLRQRLSLGHLVQLVNDQLGLRLAADQCRTADNISLFGPKTLAVAEYRFPETDLRASFELRLDFRSGAARSDK